MSYQVITISREFGSGGRTIGKEVAQRLGIPCYDQEIIEKLAEESGFSKDYIADKGEYANHKHWIANAFASSGTHHTVSNQDYLWVLQRKIICDLAAQGPCVIVGRCADYILKDDYNCLRVFIHADMEKRKQHVLDNYGERKESIEKRLKDKDKKRKAYYKYYTDTEWGVAKNYHVSLDGGTLGIERCTDIIVDIYNMESK